ncbi:hypothetical protein LCGC14_2329010 [marine sediment metagenome]|uniref:Uncharacterized protein n=1 Tax=marine sediment metagenome TaxID=412755 RepID=A0A0F9FAF7_9ZZZZ
MDYADWMDWNLELREMFPFEMLEEEGEEERGNEND